MCEFLKKKTLKRIRSLFLFIFFITIFTVLCSSENIYVIKTINSFFKNLPDENLIILNKTEHLQSTKNFSIYYKHIKNNNNASNDNILNTTLKNLCPLIPPNIETRIKINLENNSLEDIEINLKKLMPDLKLGGKWSPNNCTSRFKVAIIVPFRNRFYNLQLFLAHMHPFLSRQQLDYGIYLIEPIENITFNRGLLMNIGFVESNTDSNSKWDCFVFHDVDLLPEDHRNFYSCPETPRHMSSAVSTLNYKLPYDKIFGGVTEFTKDQFKKINGFSNLFFGWGGEDDDLRERVVKKGFSVSRYPLDIGRYTMAKHEKDKNNSPNPDRYKLLKSSNERIDMDGISSLKYDVKLITKNKLFTKIVVSYDKEEILKIN